jgi:hypothetical protein
MQWNEKKKQDFKDILAKIYAGEHVTLIDASQTADGICIGDFRDMGWSERISTRTTLFYRWLGPSTIICGGVLVPTGGCTTEIEHGWDQDRDYE